MQCKGSANREGQLLNQREKLFFQSIGTNLLLLQDQFEKNYYILISVRKISYCKLPTGLSFSFSVSSGIISSLSLFSNSSLNSPVISSLLEPLVEILVGISSSSKQNAQMHFVFVRLSIRVKKKHSKFLLLGFNTVLEFGFFVSFPTVLHYLCMSLTFFEKHRYYWLLSKG
jgi:hypothetical protein